MERLFKKHEDKSQTVKFKNIIQKKQIVRALYFNGPLSNADLSRFIPLSTPKINSLLVDLMKDGLIQDLGRGNSSGGRKPNIYGLNQDAFYIAGISISTNQTTISVFNSNNEEIVSPGHYPIQIKSDLAIFEEVNKSFKALLSEYQIPEAKVLTVGIEIPGLINQELSINKTYFPNVEHLNEELNRIFNLPVFYSHDTKIRTFAEQHFGVAKGKKDALMLFADWGLGLGIIIDEKLYMGHSGYAGEFGHLPITNNGVLCSCGKQGCLETIVSATAIVRMAREGLQNGNSSFIRELVGNDLDKIKLTTVIEAANDGDQFAISIFTEVGHWLGKGIAYLLQIFNPEILIIGGRISEAHQFIIAPIQQAINISSNREIGNDTEIVFSKLGEKAGTLGIAAYALDQIAQESGN